MLSHSGKADDRKNTAQRRTIQITAAQENVQHPQESIDSHIPVSYTHLMGGKWLLNLFPSGIHLEK